MIDSLHLIWAVVLFCTTAAWVTVGQRVANPYVPYRTSREGRQFLLLISAALSLAMAARSVGLQSLLAMESCLAAVWLGLIALAWFARL
jgi:hypothetical protein